MNEDLQFVKLDKEAMPNPLEDLGKHAPRWWKISFLILSFIAVALISYGLGVLHTLLTFSFK